VKLSFFRHALACPQQLPQLAYGEGLILKVPNSPPFFDSSFDRDPALFDWLRQGNFLSREGHFQPPSKKDNCPSSKKGERRMVL
jgi:hypothetical protein